MGAVVVHKGHGFSAKGMGFTCCPRATGKIVFKGGSISFKRCSDGLYLLKTLPSGGCFRVLCCGRAIYLRRRVDGLERICSFLLIEQQNNVPS